MTRQILGILAASVAAPYLGAVSLGISIALSAPAMPSLDGIAKFFIGIAFIGTFGLVLYGLPVLGVAIIAALILYALDARSIMAAAIPASIIGACFGILLTAPNFDDWPLIPGCFISGFICGWIYWRIALQCKASSGELLV
ncbi:hypothetical protein MHY87_17190 [Microvirga sp. ACRRW]|uniref:hypothetical protein n=1 Tax=Microvirga sp. ACRRW TaxID=2918205 RepID=UPI001EF728E1|nr:hypothetical protein [Microvirga sp. ACRRW]MCG7394642.1 hypothetical protein [Microvirga sp. ACRRW]